MTDIFLSYSSKDRDKVILVQRVFTAAGYNVFFDVEIKPGDNWEKVIRNNLSAAGVVVVCWTRNAAESPNVQHEATIARDENKLVPAMLETMKAADFPLGFYTTQAAALHDWDGHALHAGYSQLIRAVRARLEGNAAAVAEAVKKEEAADIADLRRKSAQNDPQALAELGFRYSTGLGVTLDEVEAVCLFRRAADQGNARAQFNLGVMHGDGAGGLEKSHAEEVRHYELAADQGHAGALCNLGYLYRRGQGGLQKDEERAARYYKLAAESGYSVAQYNLGIMYAGGFGLEKDEKEAVRFFRLAAKQGDVDAQKALKLRNESWY